jgi:hypothetical protein
MDEERKLTRDKVEGTLHWPQSEDTTLRRVKRAGGPITPALAQRRDMSEENKVESMEAVLAHLVAEIQGLQSVLVESATHGDATARWVVERLNKVLTVQLPDGREVYLSTETFSTETSELWEVSGEGSPNEPSSW